MPRIRTIKPEFFQDEKLAPLSPIDRLVFLGLISMADDAGRLLDNAKVIDAFIFPETDDSAHESLMRLSGIARIRRGTTASGQHVIQVVNWEKHQKVQHPQLAAALPELVEAQGVGGAHESFMSDSGGDHEALTPHTNDLRPTINDLRANSKQHPRGKRAASRPRKAQGAAGHDTWLTSAQGAWERHFGAGSFRHGKAAGQLAPLRDAGIAPEEIGQRLDRYCAERKGGFCNLADFAEHHAEWADDPDDPLVDETGVLTAAGERATRPPGVKGELYHVPAPGAA